MAGDSPLSTVGSSHVFVVGTLFSTIETFFSTIETYGIRTNQFLAGKLAGRL
jgi:hypothetical protein